MTASRLVRILGMLAGFLMAVVVAHFYFQSPVPQGASRGSLGTTDVDSWRSHVLLDLPDNLVQQIQIDGPGLKTSLVRSSQTWAVNGEPANGTAVWGLVGVLSHLRSNGFVDLSKH